MPPRPKVEAEDRGAKRGPQSGQTQQAHIPILVETREEG
jgi:hypothetical protein